MIYVIKEFMKNIFFKDNILFFPCGMEIMEVVWEWVTLLAMQYMKRCIILRYDIYGGGGGGGGNTDYRIDMKDLGGDIYM